MPDWDSIKRRKVVDKQRQEAAAQRRIRQENQRLKEEKIAKVLRSDKAHRPERPRGPMDMLTKSPYSEAVSWATTNAIRAPGDWRPVGKSVDALFFSYISHVLVKYPIPKHLYQCLAWKSNSSFPRDFFQRAAQGESVFKVLKETFPLPITRKWANFLITETHDEEHPVKAIRLAQVLAHGGNYRLYRNLPIAKVPLNQLNARPGYANTHDFRSVEEEKFTDDVIDWLCRQTNTVAMFDYNQVEPILDFFNHSRFENKDYSVAGRTLASVMKAMDDWHKFLGKGKGDNSTFPSCGIPVWTREVEYTKDGRDVKGTWKIEEILSDKRLREEGRDMRHCVASYAGSIKSGRCCIFSVAFQESTGEWKKHATMRLDPKTKTILEARSFANAKLHANTAATARRWANENGITGYL